MGAILLIGDAWLEQLRLNDNLGMNEKWLGHFASVAPSSLQPVTQQSACTETAAANTASQYRLVIQE